MISYGRKRLEGTLFYHEQARFYTSLAIWEYSSAPRRIQKWNDLQRNPLSHLVRAGPVAGMLYVFQSVY
jgi:hypothetical protein